MATLTRPKYQPSTCGNESVLATDSASGKKTEKGTSFEVCGGSMRAGRSSFALITFCTVAAVAAALAFAALFASAALAFGIARSNSMDDEQPRAEAVVFPVDAPEKVAQDSENQTFSGVVTDERCGARHQPGSDKSPAE